ncbi:MAG TPA: hypothetical protein VF787_02255 [Thermoanaerobaculia bacterium]
MLRRTFVAIAFFALSCAPNLDQRLTSEVDRLDAKLKSVEAAKLPDELQAIPKGHRARLASARAATSSEQRLVRMREAFIGIELLAMLQREKRASEDFAALQTLWTKERARFEANPPDVRGSLLRRAMMQNATNRAQKLFRASLPYGKTSAPMSGLFYFAEAEGNLRFRDFLATLPADAGSRDVPRAEVVRSELEARERETSAKFASDPSGRTSIRASAKLKEARELFERGYLEGAALALVEVNATEDAIPAALTQLAQRRNAAPSRAPKPQLVTVTLVRWPYT